MSKLQEDLETMQPLLAQAAIETEETMEKIQVDTVRNRKSRDLTVTKLTLLDVTVPSITYIQRIEDLIR